MRKVAGIILIILGVLGVSGVITLLVGLVSTFSSVPVWAVPIVLLEIVPSAFFVAGGVFCLRRKYWRVCLASASLAALIEVFVVAGLLLGGVILESWITWIVLLAMVVAILFIWRTRKEWQEISDSVDGKVSYGG